jgi:hypothetical protein
VVRLEPLQGFSKELFGVTICMFEMPMAFRSMVLLGEHLAGEAIFVVDERDRYLRALNLELMAADLPQWPDELEMPLEDGDEGLGSFYDEDEPDPDLDPPPPKPNLTLIR